MGRQKIHVIKLSSKEKKKLMALITKGTESAALIRRAHILLNSDSNGPGLTDAEVAERFHCCTNTVLKTRKRYAESGLKAALERKARKEPPRKRVLDGKGEAHLLALSCSKAPEGRNGWTMQLLADKLVELMIVESISDETVRRTLKKMKSSRI